MDKHLFSFIKFDLLLDSGSLEIGARSSRTLHNTTTITMSTSQTLSDIATGLRAMDCELGAMRSLNGALVSALTTLGAVKRGKPLRGFHERTRNFPRSLFHRKGGVLHFAGTAIRPIKMSE